LKWDDEGAFFTVNQIEVEIDLLMTIWLDNKADKFWDFPIGCLVKATTAERISYARLLHGRLEKLWSFMAGVAG